MPVYLFEARTKDGKLIKSTLEAENLDEARRELRQRGYTVRKIEERKSLLQQEIVIGGKPGVKQLAIFARQLGTMLQAGVDLSTSLRTLADQTEHPGMRKIIRELFDEVQGGRSFAEALAKRSDVFPPIFTSLVAAGEKSGKYEEVLHRVASFLERDLELRGKIRSALTYPAIVLTAAIGITYFLITGMVPQFATTLQEMGSELPALTRFLIWLADVLKAYAPLFILVIVAAFFLLRFARRRNPEIRYITDNIALRIPLVGNLQRKGAVARFSRTLALLLSAGVPILEALQVAKGVSTNAVVERTVENAIRAIEAGEPFSKPLWTNTFIFPPMAVSMIAIGEESGQLEAMLERVADYFEREVSEAVEALAAAIEPMMTIFLGGIVGVIVLAMFLPLFQLIQTLGGG